MITLHRLGHVDEPFQLNPDLIVTIESTPDTVVALATTAKVVVAESPEEVAVAMRAWRVDVLSEAMRNRRGGWEQDQSGPAQGRGGAGATQGRGGAGAARRRSEAAGGGAVQDLPRRPGRIEGLRPSADERGR
jgi:uncharacterized protein YlzI (FlbEa/FlbD family)